MALQQKGQMYSGYWGHTWSRDWHWKHHMTVGVVGDSGVLGMMIGLLLALDSSTTSSPLGSVTHPESNPGVLCWIDLSLSC